MPTSYLNLNLTTDHAVPVLPGGGTATVVVTSGQSVYYSTDADITSTHNEGTITVGTPVAFVNPVWLRSAGSSTVTVQLDSASPSAAAVTDKTRTTALTGLTQGAEATKILNAPGSVFTLYSVTVDQPCRLRIYATAGQGAADLARAQTTDPTGNHGCLYELVMTAAGTFNCSPEVFMVNQDSSRTSSFTANVRCDNGTTLNVPLAGIVLAP